ncbi:hypothetical protein [Citrobacter portucalensis]|uniref:hypothetical protein n=1 Tax=Citrobacter portucalensis TaxID=1639133 RepID=UPI0006BC6120|nr:hypothetical protein [Citrobacter portucalensis]ALD79541.1 hypothetical protein P10159_4808 [Citrobacter portucalensis]MBD9987923.1 hypothetical protein [Citrobacter portucalensis]MBE0035851.1 hypothetical protein [Citrobacter portucalensis]MBE0041125.1 hypothetical protein [Citrobacter portucalensis]MBE0045730.1 hypothetical protein [Citrobacter portucalensis]
MSSRDKFEQAIKARFGDLIDYRTCKNSDGEYMAWDMQVAWWAWQAAETDMAVQLANAESKCRELASEVSELNECKNLLEKIKSTSCHVDTSKDAVIPNSLDAWGRPVPQYLPYDFSGNPCASATQYCNGWNDAGGYWLNHVKYLQECIRAAGIGVKGE